MAYFPGRFVRFRECTPWKMNMLNLKISCEKEKHWKTSKPNLHFWIQKNSFSRVYDEWGIFVQDVFPRLVWHRNPNLLWKMLFDGIGLRSSTLLTAFQPNHGKSAGSFFGKRQKTSNISKLWLEFWEQDHQIVFNAYNNMIWYTDIGVHWLYTLEAKWPIVILIEKGLVLEGSPPKIEDKQVPDRSYGYSLWDRILSILHFALQNLTWWAC